MEEKYIGFILAISSSVAIGTSFVITKKGLLHARARHGFEGDGFIYLKSPIWWAGILTLILGELFNFAAYAFAPAILVTPLGAMSVLVSTILSSYFLDEHLGILGRLGIAICLLGAVMIVLHAPPDKEIQTVEQILHYAIQPGFIIYLVVVAVFAVVMIYKVAPVHGRKSPLIYLLICSIVGSVSVMSIKALGISVKLTFAGHNQFKYPSTYVFATLTTICILIQMNYLNKSLAHFPTNIVNPLYYVMFTTATLCASVILFKGFNTTEAVSTLSLLCGFLVTFSGVYLLNLPKSDPPGYEFISGRGDPDATVTEMASSLQHRLSLQAGRSTGSRQSIGSHHGDTTGLMRAYGEEARAEFGLADSTRASNSDGYRIPNAA